jgi:heterotetrameric sarcosine oxidase gamma subunit
VADAGAFAFTPGRIGRLDGPPGVVVREHAARLLASMIARPGQTTTLSAAAERAFGASLPLAPRFASGQGVSFIWSGPGHWLVESSSAAISMDALLTNFAGLASVFEQTDSRVLLEVSGPRVRDVLAKGLPIDLHPASFQVGCVALTSASHIGVQLWQTAADPVYRIAVARSFFDSFWQWLASSACEYGCEIIAPG